MKFRDVIRHYMGCQVQTTTEISPDDCDWGIDKGEIMTLVGINSNGDIGDDTVSNIDTYGVVLKQGDKWLGTHISDIKPLLLSLEDMTTDDYHYIWNDLDTTMPVLDSNRGFTPELFHFLTSKHYDVFNLISSGQAIRKTK